MHWRDLALTTFGLNISLKNFQSITVNQEKTFESSEGQQTGQPWDGSRSYSSEPDLASRGLSRTRSSSNQCVSESTWEERISRSTGRTYWSVAQRQFHCTPRLLVIRSSYPTRQHIVMSGISFVLGPTMQIQFCPQTHFAKSGLTVQITGSTCSLERALGLCQLATFGPKLGLKGSKCGDAHCQFSHTDTETPGSDRSRNTVRLGFPLNFEKCENERNEHEQP